MSDWEDRDLDIDPEDGEYEAIPPPVPEPADDRRPSSFVWPLVAASVLALVAGGTLYWLFSDRGPVTVPQQTTSETQPAPTPEPRAEVPAPEPAPEEEPVVLPPLSGSDAFVRDALRTLSQHPGLTSFLMTEGLARKIVAAVANIAEGANPARHFPYLAPEEPFDVVHRAPRVFLDPRTYHRYDVLVAGFESMDAQGLAKAYRSSKPLLDEAYRELGYPDQDFEGALAQAVTILLQTPVVEGRIELRADSVNYTYADARLQALSPAQKQLLRTGPVNTRKVQSKLREIAEALDLSIDS